MLKNNISTKVEGEGVSVCPGPNMAYFDKVVNLKSMVDHIYGGLNLIAREDRPNMFIKELSIYIDYLRKRFEELSLTKATNKQKRYLMKFVKNLNEGLNYYNNLFKTPGFWLKHTKISILNDLRINKLELATLEKDILALKTLA